MLRMRWGGSQPLGKQTLQPEQKGRRKEEGVGQAPGAPRCGLGQTETVGGGG